MPKKTSAPKKVLDAKKAEADAKKNAKAIGAKVPGTEAGKKKGGKDNKGAKDAKGATKGSGVKPGEYRPG